jgi:hypothetical protein
MNKELRIRVLPIAAKVREWTEAKAFRADYNPDTLCGWCAIAAAQLFRELTREKVPAEIHYVSGHCFVVIDDYVVDVTATQFDEFAKEKILIRHVKELSEHWYYQTEKVFTKPIELRDHQLKEKWPRKQIAYTR